MKWNLYVRQAGCIFFFKEAEIQHWFISAVYGDWRSSYKVPVSVEWFVFVESVIVAADAELTLIFELVSLTSLRVCFVGHCF